MVQWCGRCGLSENVVVVVRQQWVGKRNIEWWMDGYWNAPRGSQYGTEIAEKTVAVLTSALFYHPSGQSVVCFISRPEPYNFNLTKFN